MRLDPAREAAICDFCESSVFLEPNRDGVRVFAADSGRDCPVCRVPLQRAALARHGVEYCTRCGGVLIAVNEFGEILQRLRWDSRRPMPPAEAVGPEALDRAVVCPGCAQRMDTHPYAGPGNVIIDNCPRCELNWLDAREMDRIVTAPESASPASHDLVI